MLDSLDIVDTDLNKVIDICFFFFLEFESRSNSKILNARLEFVWFEIFEHFFEQTMIFH